MKEIFSSFPDHAKIWIFAATRPLTLEEHEFISARLGSFIPQWQAHGAQLHADYHLMHKRFILIAVDEGPQNATGCSIDACVHEIQAIGKELGLDFFNRMQVVYRDDENNMVVSCDTAELKEMIADQDFDADTKVFDNSLTNLGDLRSRWEIPAAKSWVARYLKATV